MIKSIFLLALIGYTSSSVSEEPSVPLESVPVETTVSDGVRSLGFNVIYGDEDMTVINQVVNEANADMNSKVNLDQELPRLPVEDVKCLMSVDRYCSKGMLHMKKILIQALQEDCSRCSSSDKERAGRVIAAMLAHDPVAWKLFLTRSALLILPEKKPVKEENPHFKIISEPEIIPSGKKRFLMPGASVRVKRFAVEKI